MVAVLLETSSPLKSEWSVGLWESRALFQSLIVLIESGMTEAIPSKGSSLEVVVVSTSARLMQRGGAYPSCWTSLGLEHTKITSR